MTTKKRKSTKHSEKQSRWRLGFCMVFFVACLAAVVYIVPLHTLPVSAQNNMVLKKIYAVREKFVPQDKSAIEPAAGDGGIGYTKRERDTLDNLMNEGAQDP